ncbi:hypothetical protein [Xanthomonas nasturtii]|uniref:hypothetical protein n=1 Tax=Xanthomonas nasturtii TaxID=1843581 RepID=UPI0011C03234|nr:hypothetical protein [Xanthomonas nasturtii]MCL1582881.1 hypothetical protein [Xanthomonas nasturtii]
MGSKVKVIILNTNASQEAKFKDLAEEISDPRGLFCADSVSSVMSGYCYISHTFLPGKLAEMADEAKRRES